MQKEILLRRTKLMQNLLSAPEVMAANLDAFKSGLDGLVEDQAIDSY